MKKIQFLILSMCLVTSLANAIVIRHDVSDENYYAVLSDFPPLATLYNIGVHGTLIHPEWVVTAAHAVFCMNPGQKIKVGDEVVPIANRYSHPKYQLGGEHDIALIKLDAKITNIEPANLYNSNTEKGSKGEGLEGVSGNGDSGGPAYIKVENQYVLFGISSRTDSWFYDIGEYGVTELYTRISSYRDWIQQVISAKDDLARQNITTQNPFLQNSMKSKYMDELCTSIEVHNDGKLL